MTKHINDRIAEHYSDIFSFVISRVDNLYIAEEITQNVMEKAIRKNSFLRKKESLKSWMMTIAANAVNDYYREVKRINAALLKEDEVFDASGEEIENIEDIKNIIRPIGTYNKKASNIISIAKALSDIGYVPNDRKFLESLDGVGRKTTNLVLSTIYNVPCIAVDTHVARVSKRLGLAKENDDVLKIEKKLYKIFPKENLSRLHHQLVLFGRYHCKSQKPDCINCELKDICKYKKNEI